MCCNVHSGADSYTYCDGSIDSRTDRHSYSARNSHCDVDRYSHCDVDRHQTLEHAAGNRDVHHGTD